MGYNWQIGIALITSFAAREVFVGSMATIYSVGEDFDSGRTLIQRMRSEKNRRGSGVHRSLRTITDDLLCFCHAVYEHPGRGAS